MNRLAAACVHGSLLLVVACAGPTQSFPDSELTSILKRSPLVFDGTVLRTEGVPSFLRGEGVDLEKSLGRRSFMLVRVDRVHQDAALPLLHRGNQVWIGQLDSTDPAKIKRATWYTQSWMSGEQVVVREVAHETRLRAKADIDRLEQAIADESLETRLRRADEVVYGVVGGLELAGETKEPGIAVPARPTSEHDADWRVANFLVRKTLKGDPKQKSILVRFAASRRSVWSESPKLKQDEVTILILRRARAEEPYVLTDPEDKRDVEELERIERLMQTHRQPEKK